MGFFDFGNDEYNRNLDTENRDSDKPAFSPLTYRMPDYNMAKWSNTLGIIAIATSACVLPALIIGPIAVIIGLLSRGGQDVLPPRAKIGVTLGAIAFVCGVGIFAYEYFSLINQYGSMEGIMEEYLRLLETYQ